MRRRRRRPARRLGHRPGRCLPGEPGPGRAGQAHRRYRPALPPIVGTTWSLGASVFPQVSWYYESDALPRDQAQVAAAARSWVNRRIRTGCEGTGRAAVRKCRVAVVFDIDDTLLSSWPYERAQDPPLSFHPDTWSAFVASCGYEPIAPTIDLLNDLRRRGVRPRHQRPPIPHAGMVPGGVWVRLDHGAPLLCLLCLLCPGVRHAHDGRARKRRKCGGEAPPRHHVTRTRCTHGTTCVAFWWGFGLPVTIRNRIPVSSIERRNDRRGDVLVSDDWPLRGGQPNMVSPALSDNILHERYTLAARRSVVGNHHWGPP